MKTDTADAHWNEEWANIEAGSKWLQPEEDVMAWAKTLRPGARVLDLGAGVGRHALWLADQGFDVTAFDAAQAGLDAIEGARLGDRARLRCVQGRMDDLPFADGSFDHVLSWNVIYHGDEEILLRTIDEIRRVLQPGGSYLGTMLSKRRLPHELAKYPGREISHNAWVFDAPGTDKIHPHYFCAAAELLALFDGFEPKQIKDCQHEAPGSWHWHIVMEKLGVGV